VVGALDDVAGELAHGKRRLAVAATVFQRDRFSLDGAIEHDRLVEHDAPEHAAPDLVVPGGDVPGVAYEHRLLRDLV
jgi:hypothetical protein